MIVGVFFVVRNAYEHDLVHIQALEEMIQNWTSINFNERLGLTVAVSFESMSATAERDNYDHLFYCKVILLDEYCAKS